MYHLWSSNNALHKCATKCALRKEQVNICYIASMPGLYDKQSHWGHTSKMSEWFWYRVPNWTSPCVGCLESIRPFWITREPVNSHSPVGLVSRQWDAADWACVLCDRRLHNDWASRDNAPAHSTVIVRAFLANLHIAHVCQPPYSADFAPCDFWVFPKLKSLLKRRKFVNPTVTRYTSSVNGVSLPTD